MIGMIRTLAADIDTLAPESAVAVADSVSQILIAGLSTLPAARQPSVSQLTALSPRADQGAACARGCATPSSAWPQIAARPAAVAEHAAPRLGRRAVLAERLDLVAAPRRRAARPVRSGAAPRAASARSRSPGASTTRRISAGHFAHASAARRASCGRAASVLSRRYLRDSTLDPRQRPAQVLAQVVDVLDADRQPHQRVADAERRALSRRECDACVMIAGCSIRLSTPPRLSASVNRCAALEEAARAGQVAVSSSTEIMPPKPCIWRLASCVLRMRRAARDSARARPAAAARASARSRSALRAVRSMRSASVFTPRSARKQSNGPAIAPTAFCRKPSRSRSSAWRRSPPTTATPPIMSEWPFRYLVVECTTMSKPSSSGRCTHGLAKVLSATAEDAALARDLGDRRQVGELEQRIGRRLDPDHAACSGGIAARRLARSVRSTKLKLEPGAALAHALEQAKGAAVEVVARDDVRAGVEQLEHRRDRRQARGEREACAAALQVGDAALEGEARRVVRAAVVEALVHARARLHVGRGRVDRRHDRAGRRIGRLAGVDRAGGESVLAAGRLGVSSRFTSRFSADEFNRSTRVIRP